MASTVTDIETPIDIERSAGLSCPERPKEGDGQIVADPEPVYSIFTLGEKRFITFVTAITTLFPPLSSSMYYPVITMLARDLNVSISDINLTITAYLIVQGIAPSFTGNLSDEMGRRPALIIAFTLFIAGCIGAAVKGDYAVLLVMRCLQSAGISGTMALSLATISDIVTSAERAGYNAYSQLGWMIGPAFGPVIGGLLSQYLGWRSIFWFLAVFAAVVLTMIVILLPETSRKIVGNGSIPPQRWNTSLLAHLHLRKQHKLHAAATTTNPPDDTPPTTKAAKLTTHLNPLSSLKLFLHKETSLLILYSGLIYASTYMILSSFPDQLQATYGLSTLHISLCYLAPGFGTVASVLTVGRLLDWNFRRHAHRLHVPITTAKQQDLSRFPIERARLEATVPFLAVAAVALVAYGWCMRARTPLAAPLVFLFFEALGAASAYSGANNLVMDLHRERPGTASAAINIARCLMGAGGVAFAGPLNEAGGVGWMAVTIAGVWIVFSPVTVLLIKYGPGWREDERVRKVEAELSAN